MTAVASSPSAEAHAIEQLATISDRFLATSEALMRAALSIEDTARRLTEAAATAVAELDDFNAKLANARGARDNCALYHADLADTG